MPNLDPASHSAWLDSKRRSRVRRAEARRARRRTRGRRTGAIVAAVSLTLAAGGAVAHEQPGAGASSVRQAGSGVAALQAALGVPADGVYGPQTRRAVRRFQRSRGLAVDGVAGPVTLAALGLSAGSATSGAAAPSPSPSRSPSATLARIAACESGGDPSVVSSSGHYRGKYQFSRATWRGLGGTGDPALAPEAEQDRLAARLLAARGTSPWPNCA